MYNIWAGDHAPIEAIHSADGARSTTTVSPAAKPDASSTRTAVAPTATYASLRLVRLPATSERRAPWRLL